LIYVYFIYWCSGTFTVGFPLIPDHSVLDKHCKLLWTRTDVHHIHLTGEAREKFL